MSVQKTLNQILHLYFPPIEYKAMLSNLHLLAFTDKHSEIHSHLARK